ncbi:glycosyltransferase family 2 protein [Alkaliphilus peptidifermentans]|uniref:Glycosyl transferase family 2 n=1 Tax=Alkaliphilus peptidifermentans DSM 18978 TaxID=1120976 RepID=A0A1G5KE55_9FIRM|nr:glycosyltransferase family 2 protein [Alkaliphilus peptidifermentans]SCY98913.1 Glycosyl transferase family 2 [Alkaliphilus peptidifermentans DSM 18978]
MKPIIAAIIPAYNEEAFIEKTLISLQKVDEITDILVVDDGSKDDTCKIVEAYKNIKLIKQPYNMGKGAALKKGVDVALEMADIVVFLDADLENSSREVKKLLKPIIEGSADVTIAKFPPPKITGGFGLVKSLAETGVYFHTGKTLTSTLSGQRAIRKEVLNNINIGHHGFGIELAMTIDILSKGYSIVEVDVDMSHRETERNISGFMHRGKQFVDIFKVIYLKKLQRMN